MKNLFKYLVILFFSVVGLGSCNPDSPETLQPSYVGTYTGTCSVYINGAFHSTQTKTISLSSPSTSGHYLMATNIFQSTSCDISGTTLNIPNTTVGSTALFDVVEYGIGSFSGNNLTIEFHQDQNSGGSTTTTGKWVGTLVKQ